MGQASFSEADERWEQPWGENRWVRDHYREMKVPIVELIGGKRRIELIARVFDHGVGFRFAFPDQPQLHDVQIDEELTEFNIAGTAEAWPLTDELSECRRCAYQALTGRQFVGEAEPETLEEDTSPDDDWLEPQWG